MPRDGSPTRERILDAAEKLVLEHGFGYTSIDKVVAASRTSKGSFFHHFESKADLAGSLVARVVASDRAQLAEGLAVVAPVADPVGRLLAFLGHFESRAGRMTLQEADCLYISALAERQLLDDETGGQIVSLMREWREAISGLVRDAVAAAGVDTAIDPDALADHVFVTFEGSFLVSKATGEPEHLSVQLGVVRRLVAALLGAPEE